jgi:16S rRNA (guanine966-N2)-methyltransferase
VRIIGGVWRRRRIALPRDVELRPTPDRVRETLFNWLAPVIPGADCLDLFAGTGALGFEALSRGAASAVLVEREPRSAAALERVRAELGATAEIVCADAAAYIARRNVGPFDIVFIDPPYAQPVDAVLAALPPLLKPGARVYLERPQGEPWPEVPGFSWLRRSRAAAVAFGLAAVTGSSGAGSAGTGSAEAGSSEAGADFA